MWHQETTVIYQYQSCELWDCVLGMLVSHSVIETAAYLMTPENCTAAYLAVPCTNRLPPDASLIKLTGQEHHY